LGQPSTCQPKIAGFHPPASHRQIRGESLACIELIETMRLLFHYCLLGPLPPQALPLSPERAFAN
jgi:hypothetical protein